MSKETKTSTETIEKEGTHQKLHLGDNGDYPGDSVASPIGGVKSFDELDAISEAEETQKVATQFGGMVQNIVDDPFIEDKPGKLKVAFNQMIDRIKTFGTKATSEIQEETEDTADNKNVPSDTRVIDEPELGLRFITKDNGDIVWFAVYSNNFRDEDIPPEIISAKSHRGFDAMLTAGEADYPELWLHHVKGTAFGKAITNAYDNDSGFSVAAGYIYPERAWIVKRLQDSDTAFGVSHGMPKEFIEYDKDDPSVIVKHRTSEISVLPMVAAANKMTGFAVKNKDKDREEKPMAFTDKARQKLRNANLSDEDISLLEVDMKNTAQAATDIGIEKKEAGKGPQATADSNLTAQVADLAARLATLTEQSNKSQRAQDQRHKNQTAATEGVVKLVTTLAQSFNELQVEAQLKQSQLDLDSDNFSPDAWLNNLTQGSQNQKDITPTLKETDPLYSKKPLETKHQSANSIQDTFGAASILGELSKRSVQ